MRASTALLTDRYELTMIDAALADGTADRACVFEVFARRLPSGRRYGVVAGTGRLLEAIESFRFDGPALDWIAAEGIVSDRMLEYLREYTFRGDITGYAEGELYFPGSPILQASGTFADAVVLETLILSILNYDSAVASAASRMTQAAIGRPCLEMGSRRAHEDAAVAAARAAVVAGFDGTSNLEAGRRYGLHTIGTAAHAFTLLHDTERDAFVAQVASAGAGTTLLVDTYDIEQGVITAVDVAGRALGAVRLDSGDLPVVAREVREQLDELGASDTRIVVSSDLDEYAIAALAAAPVDSYGVGTSVVTGSGFPTCGMVYKLVLREGEDGAMHAVAKKSSGGKASIGGRKAAGRRIENGLATEEVVFLSPDDDVPVLDEAIAEVGQGELRALQVPLVVAGRIDESYTGPAGVQRARERHAASLDELPRAARRLSAGDPAIPTEVITV
ncbi:nicotinate phosphoribosyltransferase [Salana multivorans]|uniref:Nicotinate phosphoribosyltransferase n=1 Tax=Salana multivorans TaxID=120377 RepID=A0A3N2DDY3_9MICO|nr:nicotinate phosphoribosyltransferase [Salana multivorans]OJX98001.1 MAG: nicotinate phosphoribosyltransferase [Micrococcales bacterium 73-15]ROR97644.1 nicotinate phosphoribosyltransferase [Salana multivorans]